MDLINICPNKIQTRDCPGLITVLSGFALAFVTSSWGKREKA
jgi:hypothetical protein